MNTIALLEVLRGRSDRFLFHGCGQLTAREVAKCLFWARILPEEKPRNFKATGVRARLDTVLSRALNQ